jgi:hypothetical protein
MDSTRHVVAVLSPELLKADSPRFEWKSTVAALNADALNPCAATEFLAAENKADEDGQIGVALGNKRRRKRVLNYGVIE